VRLVGDQQSPALHQAGDVRGLAPGRGRQVEHALARLRVEQLGHGHGRRLLEIVEAGRMVGVFAGAASSSFFRCGET